MHLSFDPPLSLVFLFYNEWGTHSFISRILTEFHILSRKSEINLAQICQNTYVIKKIKPIDLLKKQHQGDLKRSSIFNRCRQTPVKTPLTSCWHESDFGNCCPHFSETRTLLSLVPHYENRTHSHFIPLSPQLGLRQRPHTTVMDRPATPVFANSFIMFCWKAVKKLSI